MERLIRALRTFRTESAFFRRFFTLTCTIALQNLIVFSVGLADNIMLGGYSEAALSGVALANQVQFLLQMIVMGVGDGMIVLASQYWGERNLEPIRRIVSIGLQIGLSVTLVLALIMYFWPEQVLGLLASDKAIIAEGVTYVRIMVFSYLFFAATNILLAALRSVETVRVAFGVSLSTLVIDVCLNYLLIYGNFGAPRLGTAGAAIATLAARIVEFCIVLCYLIFFDKKIRLHIRQFLHIDRELFRQYLRVGAPVILSNTIWGIAMAVQTAVLGHLDPAVIAANSIATIVFQVITVIAYGSASASAVLTGKTIGEGQIDKLRQLSKSLQLLYLGIGLFCGIALLCSREFILLFYDVTPETQALTRQFILVLSVTVVGTSYQVPVLTGLVRGGGDTKFVLYNDNIFMWGVVIPSAVLAAYVFQLPPVVVFCCLKCDQILKCFVAVVKVNRGHWIRVLTK